MTVRKTLDQMTSDDLDQLHNELDRLRAGEEPGWDPLTEPTPGQWIARWNRATPQERLRVAEAVMRDADTARHCLLMAHEKHAEQQRDQLAAALAEILLVFSPVSSHNGVRIGWTTQHPIHPDDYQRWTSALDSKEQP